MTPARRVASCGAAEARLRVEQAEAYLPGGSATGSAQRSTLRWEGAR
jgi:hypothetical protein